MIATIEKHRTWIKDQWKEKKKNDFDGIFTPIDEISVKHVGIINRWESIAIEYVQKIC